MTYLVLGSNSFAGASCVDHFLKNGQTVVGVSRSASVHPAILAYAKNTSIKNFQFYPFDLNQQFSEIQALIAEKKPKYILDFVGQGMVAESWKTPEQWYQTNIVSKVKLHNFLRNCDFLEKYIRISTPEVYGHREDPVDETVNFNPSTPYAVSHAAIDMSLQAFYKQYQFPVVFTRFANFYGPCQQLYRIIPRTIIYALTNKKLILHGGGTSSRAFIYGEDIACALEATLQKGKIGHTYHFSGDQLISIADLVNKICHRLMISFDEFVSTGPERPGKDAIYLMNDQKAKKDLSWQPRMMLDQGIEKTIEWVHDNLSVIQTLPLEYQHKA